MKKYSTISIFVFFVVSLFLSSCRDTVVSYDNLVFDTPGLKIRKLSDKTYMHISFLELDNGKSIGCNGLIYVDSGLALILDTPVNDSVSTILLAWIKNDLKVKANTVIVHHFHEDCLGGLNAFHKNQVTSISSDLTIKLCKQKGLPVPMVGYAKQLAMRHGTQEIIGLLPGRGHTADNIVTFLPDEKILFGGCLIKANGASKGNLEDAYVEDWYSSVDKVKEEFYDVYMVVPGHGQEGGLELLDYTMNLFK